MTVLQHDDLCESAFRHAWRNSESFLVLKAFGVEDKYNSSVVDQLLDHVAGVITDKHLLAKAYNKETAKVVQAISWAAIRSVYYREMAKLTKAQFAEWERQWSAPSERLDQDSSVGTAYTDAEKQAGAGGSAQLTQEDPMPQTIFRVAAGAGKPVLVTVPLKLG